MPIIVPPSRDELGDVIAELESLGGQAKTDFRISYTRDGQTVLDVSDELYDKWESSKDKDSSGRKKTTAKAADADKDTKTDKSGDDSARKGR